MSYFITVVLTIAIWEILKYYVRCGAQCVVNRVEHSDAYRRFRGVIKKDDTQG